LDRNLEGFEVVLEPKHMVWTTNAIIDCHDAIILYFGSTWGGNNFEQFDCRFASAMDQGSPTIASGSVGYTKQLCEFRSAIDLEQIEKLDFSKNLSLDEHPS
jgi:hypothetical protein